MKSRGEYVATADKNREAIALREHLDRITDPRDARRTNIDHFQRIAIQVGRPGDDCRFELAPVGVSLDCRVEGAEACLRGTSHFTCQQDAASACSKRGLPRGECLERVPEVLARL